MYHSSVFTQICIYKWISGARIARQSRPHIDIDNAEVKQSVTDYSDSQPYHQSYSSQGTSYGFKCIENRSICINIHLFFSLRVVILFTLTRVCSPDCSA